MLSIELSKNISSSWTAKLSKDGDFVKAATSDTPERAVGTLVMMNPTMFDVQIVKSELEGIVKYDK